MNRFFLLAATLLWQACTSPNKQQTVAPAPRQQQVLQLTQLTSQQLAGLDKSQTVVLIPGGILEEHGPYLPVYTDGIWNQRLTDTLAQALTRHHPKRKVLVFPAVPLGNSGANDVVQRYVFPGTFSVRFETLRNMFLDLAVELGEQGYRKVLILHGHGAPNHLRALDQAAAFFNDTYRGTMVNLMGFDVVQQQWFDYHKTPEQAAQDGLKLHAGMSETSSMLYLAPQLVDSRYRQATSYAGNTMAALIQKGKTNNWPGYFGAPAIASAAYGKAAWEQNAALCIRYASGILDGRMRLDTIRRFADVMAQSPEDAALDRLSLQEEHRRRQLQERWLRER